MKPRPNLINFPSYSFDLPPSEIARPLPVTLAKSAKQKPAASKDGPRAKKKRKTRQQSDDAPRAFTRLMAFANSRSQNTGKSQGEDQVVGKQRRPQADGEGPESAQACKELPKILPGENMRDFAARVNTEIPVTVKDTRKIKSGKDPLGLKQFRTKKERQMHKLYDQWREEERKVQERKEEEAELAAERDIESGLFQMSSAAGVGGEDAFRECGKGSAKKRRAKEDDPWEEMRKKRGEKRPSLRDVALAPPDLTALKKFKKLPTGR